MGKLRTLALPDRIEPLLPVVTPLAPVCPVQFVTVSVTVLIRDLETGAIPPNPVDRGSGPVNQFDFVGVGRSDPGALVGRGNGQGASPRQRPLGGRKAIQKEEHPVGPGDALPKDPGARPLAVAVDDFHDPSVGALTVRHLAIRSAY